MNDLISRQTAIKAADSIIERDTSGNNDVVKAMTAWKKYIKALPSAQPDHIGEVTEMVGDAVSRQGILRLLNAVPSEEFATKAMLISGVNALPPTQPDIETLLKLAVAMAKPIEYLNLSVRSYNALKRRGVDSVAKVYELKLKENLKKIRNIGAKSADEIEDCLSAYLAQWEGGQDG